MEEEKKIPMDELINRLRDLADRSFQNGQYTFTNFLSIGEITEYYEHERELGFARPAVYGGYEGAERRMIRFGNEDELGYMQDFPISILSIQPVMSKFADDLNHRDFLGALMNLGIKREMLGDILVTGKEACVFCKDSLSDFIIENLNKVKHTSVKVNITDELGNIFLPEKKEKIIQVSSTRIDAVAAKVFNLSRQGILELFPAGYVHLNGIICTENAKVLKAGDVVSARGYGRFDFSEGLGLSKKGKLNCRVMIY